MNFTDQTPSQIDQRMTELGMKLANLRFTAQRYGRLLESGSLLPYKVAEYQATVAQALADSTPVLAELSAIDGEFTARGGWTRYYLVTNVGGHVHTSTNCSTCRPTTEFDMVWQFSGSTHEELVEAAGERACTVCFPEAPVATRTRTSNLPYDVEARFLNDWDAAIKEDKNRDKARKAFEAPKFEECMGRPKTLTSAKTEAVDCVFETHVLAYYIEERNDPQYTAHQGARAEAYRRDADAILATIGDRLGDPEALRAEVEKKAAAKFKKFYGK